MKESNALLRAALAYAQRLQWPVFPVKPRAKEPLTAHGHKDATLNEKQIRKWWAQWPQANIGVPTGVKFWALDVDPRNGGEESRAQLVAQYGALADTIRQTTGGGGGQYLYELPDQQKIGCHTAVWPGIDVKGEGGYIVVPPSIHPSGKPYVWDTAKRSILDETLNAADPWLIAEILAATNGAKPAGGPFELPPKIEKGERHKTLLRMGCSMRRKGAKQDEILAALWTLNTTRCEPNYDRAHIEKLAQDIAQRYQPASENGAPKPPDRKELVIPTPRSVAQMRALIIPRPEALVEGVLPRRGLALIVGAQRSGKTIFAAQLAIALARNQPLFDYYSLAAHGPVIVIEKDDRGGDATFQDLYNRANVPADAPLDYYGPDDISMPLGPAFLELLEVLISRTKPVLVVLDSYTALRAYRKSGGDVVKDEYGEAGDLDGLGKRLGCLILLIHHESITTRSNGSLEWDARGAGTYGLTAAAECQIGMMRYRELGDSPERLLRFRSRHLKDHQLTVRYEAKNGLFDHVLEGPAALHYPLIHQIKRTIREATFTAKDLEEPLGISRATAFREAAALVAAGALWRERGGSYRFAPDIERIKIPEKP